MDGGVLDGERVLPQSVVERTLRPVSVFEYGTAIPAEDLMIFYFTQSRGQKTRLILERAFDRIR